VQGTIADQGSPDGEPGNCFTHGGSSGVKDLIADPLYTSNFKYHIFNENSIDCKLPINPGEGESAYGFEEGNFNDGASNCGSNFSGGNNNTEIFTDCNPASNHGSYQRAFDNLSLKINQLENNNSIDLDTRRALINYYANCLKKVTGKLTESLIKLGQFSDAISLYNIDPDFKDMFHIISIYMIKGDYSSAKSIINLMDPQDEKENDLIFTLKTNIKLLENDRNYVVNNIELQQILSIANKNHSYAAYAKSLYFYITEILIMDSLPDPFTLGQRNNEDITNQDLLYQLISYPNPLNNVWNIKTNIVDALPIEIFNMQGELIHKDELHTKNYSINIQDWKSGLYLLKYKDKNGDLHTQKNIILR